MIRSNKKKKYNKSKIKKNKFSLKKNKNNKLHSKKNYKGGYKEYKFTKSGSIFAILHGLSAESRSCSWSTLRLQAPPSGSQMHFP